jgi:hypothetical protein
METLMRIRHVLITCLLCFASPFLSGLGTGAQAPSAGANEAPRQAMTNLIAQSEKLLVGVADAMPADKYGFVPTNGEFRGVRSFLKQVKHAAAVHYLAAAAVLGDAAPADAANETGPDSVRTKADALKYLTASYGYLRKAALAVDDASAFAPVSSPFGREPTTRVGLIAGAIMHAADHYGQMVEYLRMNGIVPPATGQ